MAGGRYRGQLKSPQLPGCGDPYLIPITDRTVQSHGIAATALSTLATQP
jgi:hypothetical protein